MSHNEDFLRLAAEARARIAELSPARARELLAEGAVLIDVRDREELGADPPIAGALNISRGQLELKIADAVPDKDTPVLLYCGGGNRGALATDALRQLGYTQVCNLQGGLRGWKKDGDAAKD